MKVAHLILAHKNPQQLERLLTALAHPQFDLYIHLDKKTATGPFEYLYNKPQVFEIKNRTKIYWAGYGTIQATINGFCEIPLHQYDYVNVISAQDFPIQSPSYIYQYLANRNGKEFITCESIETTWAEAASRVRKYHLINWQLPGKYRLEKIVNRLLPARTFPLDYELVGRANWFTLTPAAITYCLQFLDQHPEVIRYFKYCWGADEFIFSTILYNSPFRNRLVDNLVYVEWPAEKTGHPKVLKTSDFEKLQSSDKLFARKFDVDVDAHIITLLEEWINTKDVTIP